MNQSYNYVFIMIDKKQVYELNTVDVTLNDVCFLQFFCSNRDELFVEFVVKNFCLGSHSHLVLTFGSKTSSMKDSMIFFVIHL